MKLQDKRAVVTGGASGIGKAIAQVAIFDVNEKNLKSVVADINARGETKAYAVLCDVGTPNRCKELLRKPTKRWADWTFW